LWCGSISKCAPKWSIWERKSHACALYIV
jgi:hypothetical protein